MVLLFAQDLAPKLPPHEFHQRAGLLGLVSFKLWFLVFSHFLDLQR